MEILTIFIPGIFVIAIGYWIFLTLQDKASDFKVNLDEHRRVKRMERLVNSFDESQLRHGTSGSSGISIAILVVGIIIVILLLLLLLT